MIDLIQGDCLQEMQNIPDKSIDAIICDLPYGTTACKWDTVIPFEPLWEQYKRVIKDNGAIVLFASQPFTSALVMSNPKMFRVEWIWEKDKCSNFFMAKKHPLKAHENIIVFSKKGSFYNPQKTTGHKPANYTRAKSLKGREHYLIDGKPSHGQTDRYPRSVQKFNVHNSAFGQLHPSQKPIELLEYLVLTYTNEGDIVLDNTMGSGTTAIACMNTNRNFIGIELDEHYFAIAKKRVEEKRKEKENEAQTLFNVQT